MSTIWSNKAKLEMLKGTISLDSDTIKCILMASGYQFNRATHATYADVLASEHPTASGYTIGGSALSGIALTQNDTTNISYATWNNKSWTANGGNITSPGAILFDDTVADPADIVLGYIDFGGDQTVLDGGAFTVANIKMQIS